MSKETITFQTNLIQGALRFWSPDCNSFIFPEGPISVTLRDVYYLTGLPILGFDIPCLIDPEAFPSTVIKTKGISSFYQVITTWCYHTTDPTPQEHVSFLWV